MLFLILGLLFPLSSDGYATLKCLSSGRVNLCPTTEDVHSVEAVIYYSSPESAPCIHNVTYGIHDRRSIYVNAGCSAEFVINREPSTILHNIRCSEEKENKGVCNLRSTVKDASLLYNWWGSCSADSGAYRAVLSGLSIATACQGHFAVAAQGLGYARADNIEQETVACDSVNKAKGKCSVGGIILSSALFRKRGGSCSLHHDYFIGLNSITVLNDCKADFLVTVRKNSRKNVRENRFVSCASSYGRKTLCKADTQIVDAQVHRKVPGSSWCKLGEGYGWYGDVLWTRHDCSAEFLLNRGSVHPCNSNDDLGRTICARGVSVQEVALLQTRSHDIHQQCVEGRSYGSPAFADGTGFWVSSKCKGDFWINRKNDSELELIHCDSNNAHINMFTLCPLAGQGRRVSIIEEFSRQNCGLDRTYKLKGDSLLVSGHCNALFVVEVQRNLNREAGRTELTCTSTGRYVECEAGTTVRNLRLTSKYSGSCRHGLDYGFRATKVWVNNHCRAQFLVNE